MARGGVRECRSFSFAVLTFESHDDLLRADIPSGERTTSVLLRHPHPPLVNWTPVPRPCAITCQACDASSLHGGFGHSSVLVKRAGGRSNAQAQRLQAATASPESHRVYDYDSISRYKAANEREDRPEQIPDHRRRDDPTLSLRMKAKHLPHRQVVERREDRQGDDEKDQPANHSWRCTLY